MKRIKNHPLAVSLFILAVMGSVSNAQTNEQMVTMVKNMIAQFRDFNAEDIENEQIVEGSAILEPGFKLSEKSIYSDGLASPEALFSLEDLENGYTVIDEKEYPTNAVNLVFRFESLPGFTLLNSWYELKSFRDSDGKDLLFSEKDLEKYRDLGIIEDDFNYPVPGEYSTRLWLKREVRYEESLTASGTLWLEYPSGYEQAAFQATDEGTGKKVGTTEITLIGMDRNLVTLLIKGNRREVEGLKMLILNKDGKQFAGYNAMAIDAKMFDLENKRVRELTDEEIAASVEGFNMADMNMEQVKKIKVYGNVDRIVFLKIDDNEQLEIPFTVTVSNSDF